MYVCMYVCICIYIYRIYTYTHIYIYVWIINNNKRIKPRHIHCTTADVKHCHIVSHCILNVSSVCVTSLHNTPEEEDHPSEPRPYKQYCTTVSTLVKAEATLIGSSLRGDVDETDVKEETTGDHSRHSWEDVNIRCPALFAKRVWHFSCGNVVK